MKLSEQIQHIIRTWEECSLNDVAKIIDLRRTVSVYYYQLTELKAEEERYFIQTETDRKIAFNNRKNQMIDEGNTAAKATSIAEVFVADLRREEIKHERLYKTYRDYLGALDHVLNAMSSAIKVAENEQRQSNYHT